MRRSSAAGFTLVEMIVAAALMCLSTGILLRLAVSAQQAVISQGELADLQQRLRVATAALHQDLLMAGAGPSQGPARGPLNAAFPPIRPARTGERNADPEIFHARDRISLLHVPDSGSQTALAADAGGPGAPLLIDAAWPGCPQDGSCGFAPGDRAIVFDPSGSGAYDIFTVASTAGALVFQAAGASWSHAYRRGSPVVALIQRVYYLDGDRRRLMVYDGEQSAGPLIDHVVELQFSYFAGPSGPPMGEAELVDGPFLGAPPNRFDADLLRVRRVRVTLTLETPGARVGLDARLQRRRVSFDVTPRNLMAGPR